MSEAIPRFAIGSDAADFIVINGQSARYHVSLIMLGNPAWARVNISELLKESERLESLLRWCKDHDGIVRRSLALRMTSHGGAWQIAPASPYGRGYPLRIDAKLLCGRREEYGLDENNFRNEIYRKTNHTVDIISYDRVVDALIRRGN